MKVLIWVIVVVVVLIGAYFLFSGDKASDSETASEDVTNEEGLANVEITVDGDEGEEGEDVNGEEKAQ